MRGRERELGFAQVLDLSPRLSPILLLVCEDSRTPKRVTNNDVRLLWKDEGNVNENSKGTFILNRCLLLNPVFDEDRFESVACLRIVPGGQPSDDVQHRMETWKTQQWGEQRRERLRVGECVGLHLLFSN